VLTSWVAVWLVAVAALIGLTRPIAAQTRGWERDGLEGRQVRALAIEPRSAAMMALSGGARDPYPLWVRNDRGWSQPGAAPSFILALAPLPEGGLLLGTGRDIADQPGVFLLTDNSTHYRRLYDVQAVGVLAVARGGPGSDVYVASAPWADREAGSELLWWEAASGSWSVVFQGTLECGETRSYFKQIMLVPSSPTSLFALEWCFSAAAQQTQLWRSDDQGRNWMALPTGAAHPLISTAAVDPLDANILYLAGMAETSQPGVAQSLDGGYTWTLKGETVDGLADIRVLLVDPRASWRVLAGTQRNGVFMSEDYGETWAALPGLEGLRIWSLVVDEPGGRLLAATSDGVWRTELP
jgi:hypothetical protein